MRRGRRCAFGPLHKILTLACGISFCLKLFTSWLASFLGGGELTAEQIEQLKDNIGDLITENLGVVGDALETINNYTPDWWLRLEEAAQDAVAGAIGDDARDMLGNLELPGPFQEVLCEEFEE